MSLDLTNAKSFHHSGALALGAGSLESITAAKVIDHKDNGKTFLLDGGTGVAITLPAPKVGMKLKFITALAFTTDYVITATGAIMHGSFMEAGVVQLCAGGTTLTLEDGTEALGDYIDMVSDGTSWFVGGNFSTAASITVA